MIVDAGGGTVDLSTYTFAEAKPIEIEEIAPPGCKPSINRVLSLSDPLLGVLQGSVFVRDRASKYLKGTYLTRHPLM